MKTNRTTMKTTFVERRELFPQRKESIGLLTSPQFQLKLLEGAVKGKRAFEEYWDEDYDIQQQLLWHEISQEVDLWESTGSLDLLIGRGRTLAVKLKDEEKSLHLRALEIYCSIMEISRKSRVTAKGSTNKGVDHLTTSYRPPAHNKNASDSLLLTFPDPFSGRGSIPESLTGDMLQGEPSCEPSYNREGKRSIFGSLAETDKSYQNASTIAPESVDDWKIPSGDERGRMMSVDEESQPGSVKWSKKREKRFSSKNDDRRDSIGWEVNVEILDEKEDLQKPKSMSEMGNRVELKEFPGKFEVPVEWKIDEITCTASSIEEIRSKHDVLVEGAFEKRRMAYRWANYYGFLLSSGALIYFGQEKNKGLVFKKAVDFRDNTISDSKEGQLKLTVSSKKKDWLLKFATKENYNNWLDAIHQISRRCERRCRPYTL